MLTERKIPGKPEQIEQRYAALRFEKLADIPMNVVLEETWRKCARTFEIKTLLCLM